MILALAFTNQNENNTKSTRMVFFVFVRGYSCYILKVKNKRRSIEPSILVQFLAYCSQKDIQTALEGSQGISCNKPFHTQTTLCGKVSPTLHPESVSTSTTKCVLRSFDKTCLYCRQKKENKTVCPSTVTFYPNWTVLPP